MCAVLLVSCLQFLKILKKEYIIGRIFVKVNIIAKCYNGNIIEKKIAWLLEEEINVRKKGEIQH